MYATEKQHLDKHQSKEEMKFSFSLIAQHKSSMERQLSEALQIQEEERASDILAPKALVGLFSYHPFLISYFPTLLVTFHRF